MNKLACKWMSLELSSPFIMASLTLMSNVNLESQVNYYKKISMMGTGAIVLPSVNPSLHINSDNNSVVVDSLFIDTGLNKNHRMGFAVLGPTTPNIIPLDYGVSLAHSLKKSITKTPILASIANVGEDYEIIDAVNELSKTGVDGIELNFSCPNVSIKDYQKTFLTNNILKEVRRITDLPISLKITPYNDFSLILDSLNGEIDGLTLSNAYIGLMPPKIEGDNYSPFERRIDWAPCGVYGPFERILTFYQLLKYHKFAKKKNLSIACVGGIVNEEEAIQAILLGADVVQFSSAVAWHGIQFFQESNAYLSKYLEKHNFDNIKSLKGSALPYIKNSSDELSKPFAKGKMKVVDYKCKHCKKCKCCDRLCVAISQDQNGIVKINNELCSGCKWCYYLCAYGAIEEDKFV